MMTLEHLRTFARAAELGSFTKAADSLGLAQPSVSRIIGDLELEWNGTLFYRTGRGVELSDLGRKALEKARSLLRDVDQFSDDMRSVGGLPSGNVTLALPPSLISSLVPRLLNRLRVEKPGIQLRIYEGFSEQIERWLSDGIVDIGLYSEYHLDGKYTEKSRTELLLMSNSRVVLAGPAGSRDLPAQIDFKQLAEFPLVLPAPTNGMRLVLDALAKRMSVKLTVVAEADSVLAQEAITLECGCYMLRGENAIADERMGGNFAACRIRNPSIHRRLLLSTVRQKPLSRAAREVASLAALLLRKR
jgi:LysR family transcriptional regulator, nitrogen assimilation regulatory protein